MKLNPKHLIAALAVGGVLFLPSAIFAQGSLTPPGAPTPTMKTLQQVEPRTDLQATPAPAGVDTMNDDYHFIINQPGSYYLSANLGVTKAHGIRIDAEGVTLDLSGFELTRASGSGGEGIEIASASHRATVRNGSIKGFAYGVRSILSGDGDPRGCAFRDLAVSGCTTLGISAGDGAVLEACRVHDNSGSAAIETGDGSTLADCTASRNSATYGIFAGVGSTLTNCSASRNSSAYGIYAENGSTLTNCSAATNTSSSSISAGIGTGNGCTISQSSSYVNISTAATLTPTTGMGFHLGARNTIQGCTAANNRGDGIKIFGDSVVRENTCDSNGFGGDGAGIHATSSDNRIEGNNVTGNDRGIDVDLAGNLIIKNSASGNASNYEIVANNVFGEIVDRTVPASAAVSGSSAAGSASTTDPWANISY